MKYNLHQQQLCIYRSRSVAHIYCSIPPKTSLCLKSKPPSLYLALQVEHYRVIYKDNKLTIDEDEYFDQLTKLVEVSESGGPG